jgi:hypothetical protein
MLTAILNFFISLIGIEPDPDDPVEFIPMPEPADILPPGWKLMGLPNGNYHVIGECGEVLRSNHGHGWTVEAARRALEAVLAEAKRRRADSVELNCNGRE